MTIAIVGTPLVVILIVVIVILVTLLTAIIIIAVLLIITAIAVIVVGTATVLDSCWDERFAWRHTIHHSKHRLAGDFDNRFHPGAGHTGHTGRPGSTSLDRDGRSHHHTGLGLDLGLLEDVRTSSGVIRTRCRNYSRDVNNVSGRRSTRIGLKHQASEYAYLKQ